MERYRITVGDKIHEAIYDSKKIIIDGKESRFTTKEIENDLIDIHLENSIHRTYCSFKNNQTEAEVWVDNHLIKLKLEDVRALLLNRFQAKSANTQSEVIINAPMPGLVKKIEIAKDDTVKRGQGLVILEAMKMENEIKSPVDGRIKEIRIENNISVEKDQTLIIIEAI
jgi:biotin carboxyl carrier protein